jgi:hypothetical protein
MMITPDTPPRTEQMTMIFWLLSIAGACVATRRRNNVESKCRECSRKEVTPVLLTAEPI